MPHRNPVFDIEKCPVPFVQAIPQRQIIQDCAVPGPPDPIADCPDADVPVPPPFTPPPACPQFQTEVTVAGDAEFTVTVEQLDEDPCIFKFIYDLTIGGGGGSEICATATIQCETGDCNVFLDVVQIVLNPQCQGQGQFQQQFQSQCQEQQQCQIQFRFQFQIPQGQRGPQGPQGPQGGGKFAIVRVSDKGRDSYLGLFCTEMPEAVFMDVVDLRLQAYQTTVQMDPIFEKVCEKGSFKVISVVTSEPITIGASIVDSLVVVKAPAYRQCPEATVLVKGIRKGFADRRFPAFTRKQMEQNEGFWGASFDR